MSNGDFEHMSDTAFAASLESDFNEGVSLPGEAISEETNTDLEVEGDEPQPEEVEEGTGEEATVETEEEVESEETDGDEPTEETDNTEAEVTLDPQLVELFTPFKASGSEMKVETVAEARQLMQMGVDYQNKMRAFKPHRKTVKMLENNKIDEARLNYLIDLSKGDKNAIAKLIKENEYDVHELDQEESSYSPSDYSVSDVEVDLDDVIGRIQSSEAFATTSDIVSNQWDKASKQAVFENPIILENLNTQVANGTYSRVKQEVIRLQAFGGLQGLSDLQAYHQVGTSMEQAGKLNAPAQAPKVVTTKPKGTSNNTSKKLRASPAKRTQAAITPSNDFEHMSDAEFEETLNK